MNELEKLYSKRREEFAKIAKQLEAKYQQFSLIRLVAFFVGTGLIILLWSTFSFVIGLISILLFLFAFGKFVFWHREIQRLQRHNASLSLINHFEELTQQDDYSNFKDGEEFANPNHPNSIDLDLFGAYSFFQFTNRTSTVIGKERLAQYLENIADQEEILSRQKSISELKNLLDWRQNFQAYGLAIEDEIQHIHLLKKWLEESPFVSNNSLYRFAVMAAPIWTVLSIVALIFWIPWQIAILFLIPPGWLLKKTFEQVNQTHTQTTHAEKILSFYARLINHIETQDFESKKLADLKAVFLKKEQPASKKIDQLSYIIRQLNVRYNPFAMILNIATLWDLKYIWQLEKWKAEQKEFLPKWFDSLAEFEAVLSLSTLYYNNPDWVFPTIQDDSDVIAKELGHPLISAQKRICNNIDIPTKGHIKLVTGSNMAGKSTFLRTVGLNIVLAMCGAPVCAKEMTLPSLKVYSSMRTQDALHESTSSFYAELKRLKFIIEAVESEGNIFFLLDEILKGTNSNDRHTGSKALIRQLIKSKGSGIIATHDLELGNLEVQSEGAIENLRMEVEIKDDKLFFDYKLKKGVSESFNATLLMKNMGIRIE
ncbi:MAG: hypothetical protein P1U70_01840 [Saprospiraceae bacterium]|jgi:DNA mismatch repair ATPase MutS|nr:hypothetical protein [Saprospiraceae bacterium]